MFHLEDIVELTSWRSNDRRGVYKVVPGEEPNTVVANDSLRSFLSKQPKEMVEKFSLETLAEVACFAEYIEIRPSLVHIYIL